MQTTILYHLGAPGYDWSALFMSLGKDPALLAQVKTKVSRPRTYRNDLRAAMMSHRVGDLAKQDQQALLRKLTGDEPVSRLFLSDYDLLSAPSRLFSQGRFLANAGKTARRLREVFADNPVEFYLSIRNPASLIPEIFAMQNEYGFQDFINGCALGQIRWSDVLQSIHDHVPECPLSVWQHEDTPTLWPSILRRASGVDDNIAMAGDADICAEIMSPEGYRDLCENLQSANFSLCQRRDIIETYLARFALEDKLEQEVDLPGWDQSLITQLTQSYEQDTEKCRRINNTAFLF